MTPVAKTPRYRYSCCACATSVIPPRRFLFRPGRSPASLSSRHSTACCGPPRRCSGLARTRKIVAKRKRVILRLGGVTRSQCQPRGGAPAGTSLPHSERARGDAPPLPHTFRSRESPVRVIDVSWIRPFSPLRRTTADYSGRGLGDGSYERPSGRPTSRLRSSCWLIVNGGGRLPRAPALPPATASTRRRPSRATWPACRSATTSPRAGRASSTSPKTPSPSRRRRSRACKRSSRRAPATTRGRASTSPTCSPRGSSTRASARTRKTAARRSGRLSDAGRCGVGPGPRVSLPGPASGRSARRIGRLRRQGNDDDGAPSPGSRSRRSPARAVLPGASRSALAAAR